MSAREDAIQLEDLHPFSIRKIEARVYRAPIETPVQTSFGIMRDRPAVVVCLTDEEGFTGIGEVWCNYPTSAAEHRAHLVIDHAAPIVGGRVWQSPQALQRSLTEQLEVLAIQAGEPGPVAQVIAGLDMAAWDLVARRSKLPLWRLLGGRDLPPGEVRVYASGLNPTSPLALAQMRAAEGYRAFKLKVGFGMGRDLENIASLRQGLPAEAELMVDANQAWDLSTAIEMSAQLDRFHVQWLEEPLKANAPLSNWQTLASRSPIRLAAGENLRDEQFEKFMDASVIKVVQPDIAKWGGFSQCVPLGREIARRGLLFCPHWLGSGVGLVASLHLKAAVGGPGSVEVDANENPLRQRILNGLVKVTDGTVAMTELPGLGIAADCSQLDEFLTSSLCIGF